MPINLADTGCLATVNVSEFINGVQNESVYSGIASINCIPFIIQNLIFWLLVFAGTVALILVIIAGIKFITSGGDAKQAEGARKTLTFAILGLILIMFSFAILRFIAQTTGLNCITKFGFSQCTYTPKGVEGKPNEVTCDPNIHKKSCVGSGDHKRCSCVNKSAASDSETGNGGEDNEKPKKKCTTYGPDPKCGNGEYCNLEKICADIPNITRLTCNTLSGRNNGEYMVSTECPPNKNPGGGTQYGKCIPAFDPNIPNCTVPGTCKCDY